MKRITKKAFTMIELLFVLVVLSSLAAIAIPNMTEGAKNAKKSAMESDMSNIINIMHAKYVEKPSFAEILPTAQINGTSSGIDGFAVDTFADGSKIPLTTGNLLSITYTGPANSKCQSVGSRFVISIINHEYSATQKLEFDSCIDSKPLFKNI